MPGRNGWGSGSGAGPGQSWHIERHPHPRTARAHASSCSPRHSTARRGARRRHARHGRPRRGLPRPLPGAHPRRARPRPRRPRHRRGAARRRSATGSTSCTPSTTASLDALDELGIDEVAAASCSTSASPRCSSTRSSAASPTRRMRRSTCAWTPPPSCTAERDPRRVQRGATCAASSRSTARRSSRRATRAASSQRARDRRRSRAPASSSTSSSRRPRRPCSVPGTRPSASSRPCASRSTRSCAVLRAGDSRRARHASRSAAASSCSPTSRSRTASSSACSRPRSQLDRARRAARSSCRSTARVQAPRARRRTRRATTRRPRTRAPTPVRLRAAERLRRPHERTAGRTALRPVAERRHQRTRAAIRTGTPAAERSAPSRGSPTPSSRSAAVAVIVVAQLLLSDRALPGRLRDRRATQVQPGRTGAQHQTACAEDLDRGPRRRTSPRTPRRSAWSATPTRSTCACPTAPCSGQPTPATAERSGIRRPRAERLHRRRAARDRQAPRRGDREPEATPAGCGPGTRRRARAPRRRRTACRRPTTALTGSPTRKARMTSRTGRHPMRRILRRRRRDPGGCIVGVFVVRLVDIQVVRAAALSAEARGPPVDGRHDLRLARRHRRRDGIGARRHRHAVRHRPVAEGRECGPIVRESRSATDKTTRVKVPLEQSAAELGAITGITGEQVQAIITDALAADPDSDFAFVAKRVDADTSERSRRSTSRGSTVGAPEPACTRTAPSPATSWASSAPTANAARPDSSTPRTPASPARTASRVPDSAATGCAPRQHGDHKPAKDGGTLVSSRSTPTCSGSRSRLAAQAQAIGADWATSTVQEVKTGKLLAVADYPTVDPNESSTPDRTTAAPRLHRPVRARARRSRR